MADDQTPPVDPLIDIPATLDVASLPDDTKKVSRYTLKNRLRKNKAVRVPPEAKQSPYSDIPTVTGSGGSNYALAFVLYVNGIRLPQVAKDLGISPISLNARAVREKWSRLVQYGWDRLYKRGDREQLEPIPKAELDRKLEKKIQRIDENRGQVIELAGILRTKLIAVARGLDQVPEAAMADHEVLSNMTKSIASLARAAKDIADMSMIAHGDENVIRHLGAGFNASKGNSGPAIVINIPSALANSRRQMISVEKVIDASEGAIRRIGGNDDDAGRND